MENVTTPEEQKFLKVLASSLSPFDKFVAKSDIEEILPIVPSRVRFIEQLIRLLQLNSPYQILPLLSSTGQGKTFVLWEVKKSLKVQAPAVFMEVPSNARTFYYNFYTKIIEAIGANELREITSRIVNEWGGNEKKYGLFRTSNTQKVLATAMDTAVYQTSENKNQTEQVIKIIIAHAMDPEKTPIAERWLLGENMDVDDLAFLGIDGDLSDLFMAEEAIKLIVNHLNNGIILMFDDLDKTYHQYNKSSYIEEGAEDEEEILAQSGDQPSFFYLLNHIIEQVRNLKIVITLQKEKKEEFLQMFPKSSRVAIHWGLEIPKYTLQDTKQYFIDAIALYRRKNRLDEIPSNPYFPLNEHMIETVHNCTNGNPREVIRLFGKLFDAIIFGDNAMQELENYCRNIQK